MTTYWLEVARKDFADAVRSRLFWALSVLMLALAAGGMYVPQAIDDDPVAADGIAVLSQAMVQLVPIIGLVVGYMAVVGERQTGSIRMLLSLPLKRSEVLVGKYAGRTAVVVVPILLGFALAVPVVFAIYGSVPVGAYGSFVTRVALTGAVFVAIAVGVSGSVATRGRALALVVGVFVVFEFFWDLVPVGLYLLFNGELVDPTAAPTWYNALLQVPPTNAVAAAVDGLGEASTAGPLVALEWVAAPLVIAWLVVPLAIAHLRFTRADIS